MTEAEEENLENYTNLGEFFRRKLKVTLLVKKIMRLFLMRSWILQNFHGSASFGEAGSGSALE
jgi:hypothetical protein